MLKKSLVAVCLFAMFSTSVLAGVTTIEGYQAYRDENYAAALRIFQPLAREGDQYAQYTLGVMHAMGQGVTRDDKKAVKFYVKSASQGFDDAQFALGKMYKHARGVTRDYKIAAKWFKKASVQGHAKSTQALQELCEYRKWICE